MSQNVTYKTAETTPSGGPSPIIWADCPVITFEKDPGKGIHIMEDFLSGVIADDTRPSPYFTLVGTNPDIDGVSDEVGGVVEIEGSGAGDDEAYLVSNILYELKKNNRKKMWFEAKIKVEDADDDSCIICGLGEKSLLAADAMADDDTGSTTLNDYDFIGFHAGCDGTNMDDIDCVYHEDGDGGTVTRVDEAVGLTAGTTTYDDTYIQLGMYFDGLKTVTFYVDGVAVDTTLDIDDFATNTEDELDPLGIIVGIKNLAGTASFMAIDWIRFACER